MVINRDNGPQDRSELRRKRNQISKCIKQRAVELAEQRMNALADEIENANDSRKMFSAMATPKIVANVEMDD